MLWNHGEITASKFDRQTDRILWWDLSCWNIHKLLTRYIALELIISRMNSSTMALCCWNWKTALRGRHYKPVYGIAISWFFWIWIVFLHVLIMAWLSFNLDSTKPRVNHDVRSISLRRNGVVVCTPYLPGNIEHNSVPVASHRIHNFGCLVFLAWTYHNHGRQILFGTNTRRFIRQINSFSRIYYDHTGLRYQYNSYVFILAQIIQK